VFRHFVKIKDYAWTSSVFARVRAVAKLHMCAHVCVFFRSDQTRSNWTYWNDLLETASNLGYKLAPREKNMIIGREGGPFSLDTRISATDRNE